jgi:hypothetical protein
VPAPVREQSRERGDERTVGRSKPRALLLTSENRELVPKARQFEVLGELGSSNRGRAASERQQRLGKRGREHQPILPGPAAPPSRLTLLARISRIWYSRARVNS